MYIIIALIIFIIVLSEFYYGITNSKINISVESLSVKKLDEKINFPEKYNEYSVKGDKTINHHPGYIYLKENFNLFIKENDKTFLAKKDKVYKINSEFGVEVLDVNGKDTIYYYIKSQ
jgi:hypothetical protein